MIGIWHFIRLRGAGLCLACLLGLLAAPVQAEKRVALAIGNDVYPNLPADRQLTRTANDAGATSGRPK